MSQRLALPAALVLLGGVAALAAPRAAAAPAATIPPAAAASAATTPPALPQAEPKEVRSRLSKAQPRLGEPFDWEIELRHGTAESYALPGQVALPPFQATPMGCRRAPAADRRERPGDSAGQDSITTCTVRLTLFELGAHDLPPLRLEAATPAGRRVLDVPGPRVEAAGVIDPRAPAESLKLRDPAAAVPLLLPTWRPVWLGLGALALVLLAWLGWRAWRRRAARAAAPAPPVPPAERFARRLDALEAERLPEQGKVREYFFRLSEAVRQYVGALTGVNAPDLTTAELVEALRGSGEAWLDVEALRGFSEDADLIKFARFPAGGYECDAGMRYARELLARTRPAASPGATTSTSTADGPRSRL
jgi:hypothetical protein